MDNDLIDLFYNNKNLVFIELNTKEKADYYLILYLNYLKSLLTNFDIKDNIKIFLDIMNNNLINEQINFIRNKLYFLLVDYDLENIRSGIDFLLAELKNNDSDNDNKDSGFYKWLAYFIFMMFGYTKYNKEQFILLLNSLLNKLKLNLKDPSLFKTILNNLSDIKIIKDKYKLNDVKGLIEEISFLKNKTLKQEKLTKQFKNLKQNKSKLKSIIKNIKTFCKAIINKVKSLELKSKIINLLTPNRSNIIKFSNTTKIKEGTDNSLDNTLNIKISNDFNKPENNKPLDEKVNTKDNSTKDNNIKVDTRNNAKDNNIKVDTRNNAKDEFNINNNIDKDKISAILKVYNELRDENNRDNRIIPNDSKMILDNIGKTDAINKNKLIDLKEKVEEKIVEKKPEIEENKLDTPKVKEEKVKEENNPNETPIEEIDLFSGSEEIDKGTRRENLKNLDHQKNYAKKQFKKNEKDANMIKLF